MNKNFNNADPTKICLDPFDHVNHDLHDMITQHFNGKDLVNITGVSKSWSSLSNDRDKISNKVEFKWHFPTLQNCKEDFNAAKESKRIYKVINAKYNYRSPKGVWFSVIEKHLDHLEKLSLDFKDPPSELTPKTYPKLKHLILPDVNVDVMKWLEITEIRNLQTLILHKNSNGSVDLKQLLKFIQRQTQLKRLDIYPFIGFIDFYEDSSDDFNHHNFKLDYLRTEGNYFSTLKFLMAQKENLRSIEIFEVYSETMIRSLLHQFPYLDTLSIQLLLDENDDIFKNGFDRINMGVNHTIKSLGIGFVYDISYPATIALASTCPMIKILKLLGSDDHDVSTISLTVDLMKWIALNLKKLEIIYYRSIDETCQDFYDQIKLEEGMNRNIKFSKIEH